MRGTLPARGIAGEALESPHDLQQECEALGRRSLVGASTASIDLRMLMSGAIVARRPAPLRKGCPAMKLLVNGF